MHFRLSYHCTEYARIVDFLPGSCPNQQCAWCPVACQLSGHPDCSRPTPTPTLRPAPLQQASKTCAAWHSPLHSPHRPTPTHKTGAPCRFGCVPFTDGPGRCCPTRNPMTPPLQRPRVPSARAGLPRLGKRQPDAASAGGGGVPSAAPGRTTPCRLSRVAGRRLTTVGMRTRLPHRDGPLHLLPSARVQRCLLSGRHGAIHGLLLLLLQLCGGRRRSNRAR